MDELEWENFERLCLRLLQITQQTEAGFDGTKPDARLYGTRGQAQQGIDVYSHDPIVLGSPRPERYAVTLQSRRVRDVSAAALSKAVADFRKGSWASVSRRFIYATSASAVSTQFSDTIQSEKANLAEDGVELVIWDAEEMSRLLRSEPKIVDAFFGRAWVDAFCDPGAAQGLKGHLDAQQVADLRSDLRRIYAASFKIADTGLVRSSIGGGPTIPLAQRFVSPDLILDSQSAAPVPTRAAHDAPDSESDPDGYAHVDASPDEGKGRLGESEEKRYSQGSVSGDWLRMDTSWISGPGEPRREGSTPADDWLGTSAYQLILGGPGSGKSTILRHLVLQLLGDNPTWTGMTARLGDRLPVWLPFHFFTQRVAGATGREASVANAIRAWLEQNDSGHTWPLVEKALEDERLLLVVDGLDEWINVDAGRFAVAALESFAAARNASLLLSTRPYGLSRLPLSGEWSRARIATLSRAQQREVARPHFEQVGDGTDHGGPVAANALDGFIDEISSSVDIRVMAGVPLFLLLLVSIRLTGAHVPSRRFDVFDRAIQVLIEDQPSRRRVAAGVTSPRDGILASQMRAVLAEVAFHAQDRGDLRVIDQEQVRRDVIASLTSRDVLSLDASSATTEASRICDVAEGEVGLLVRQGPTDVGFIHRAIQEHLAAEYVVTRMDHPAALKLLATHLADEPWREVLLSVVWRTNRPDEVRDFTTQLRTLVADTPEGLAAAELLAEIVFGPYGIPGGIVLDQAPFLADRAETHPVLSHRARLIAHIVLGLDSVTARDLVEERLRRWAVLSHRPYDGLVYQLRRGPSDNASVVQELAVLADALGSLDENLVWAAAAALDKRASEVHETDSARNLLQQRVKQILHNPSSAFSAAAALAVQCLIWPDDSFTALAIEAHRNSQTEPTRAVALAHLLGVLREGLFNEQPSGAEPDFSSFVDEERSWLRERLSAQRDAGTHDGILVAVVVTTARESAETLEYCLDRLKAGTGPDQELVWRVALRAYWDEERLALLAAQRISTEKYLFGLLGFDRRSIDLVHAFGENRPHRPIVAEAIETRLGTFDYQHQEVELNGLSRIDQGPRMKSALLSHLAESSVPHWAASALAENFGDANDVQRALVAVATGPAPRASQIGVQIPIVLGHEKARDELMRILRELEDDANTIDSARQDMVAQGLGIACKDIENDPNRMNAICQEALSLLPDNEHGWRANPAIEVAANFFPCRAAAEFLRERDSGNDRDRDLGFLLFAYREAPEERLPIVKRTQALLRVPPPSLRYLVNQLLSTNAHSPLITMKLTENWATDAADRVKSAASLAYHRALRQAHQRGEVSDSSRRSALQRLGEAAASYGHDHEAKRRAAWVGMCVLGDWTPVDDRRETIGEEAPIGVGLVDALSGPDEILVDQVASHWSQLRAHFGDQLPVRLSGLRGKDANGSPWVGLASVAARYPLIHGELTAALEDNADLLSHDTILEWFLTSTGRSHAVITEAILNRMAPSSNERGVAVRIAQSRQTAGLDQARLLDALPDLARSGWGGFGNPPLEVLATLDPAHPIVQEAWARFAILVGLADADPEELAKGDVSSDYRYEPHVETYLAVSHACVPSRDYGRLLARDLQWLNNNDGLRYFEPAFVRHARRRLRTDPEALAFAKEIAEHPEAPLGVTCQVLSILSALPGSDEWLSREAAALTTKLDSMECGATVRDVVIGASVSMRTALTHAIADRS